MISYRHNESSVAYEGKDSEALERPRDDTPAMLLE